MKLKDKIKFRKIDNNVEDYFINREVYAKIINCHDGDTCTFVFFIKNTPIKLNLRINGIDTAELTTKINEEYILATKAKELLENLVLNKNVIVYIKGWDKYGGRVLGDIYETKYMRKNKKPISEILLESGLAIPYNGKKKNTDWIEIYNKLILTKNI